MRKTLSITLVVVALVAAACGGGGKKAKGPTGPQTYNIQVDAATPPGQQISAYFPGVVKVRPGDTLVFTNKAAGTPHTITFGLKNDNSNRPAPVTQAGAPNPVAFGPCFTDADLAAGATACPTPPNPANAPAFGGKGFWNSGVIANNTPNTSPKVTVKLGDSIPVGLYKYVCLLHSYMAGAIKVMPKDKQRLSPTAESANGDAAATKAVTSAAALKPPAAQPGKVTAGWGDRVVAINGFDPATISAKVGELVTWTAANPYEPHTVTFQSTFTSPEQPGALAPAGVASGGSYTSGLTSSGIFGPPPFFPSASFSLKFSKAGTYKYVCVLHPGMAGTVTVT
jgi:plastocyanin